MRQWNLTVITNDGIVHVASVIAEDMVQVMEKFPSTFGGHVSLCEVISLRVSLPSGVTLG